MSNAWPRGETGLAGREFAGVSPSITRLPLSSVWCLGHWTIHSGEQQDLLLVEEWRMEWVSGGKQGSRPNLTDIIFKNAVVKVSAKMTFAPQMAKVWVHRCLRDHFSDYVLRMANKRLLKAAMETNGREKRGRPKTTRRRWPWWNRKSWVSWEEAQPKSFFFLTK